MASCGLTSIPRGLPGGIRELDLSFNYLPVIRKDSFAFSARTLESLIISNSKVFRIDPDALDDLQQLRRLDLSFNLFQTFPLAGDWNLCVRSRLQHFDFSSNNHLVCDCNSLVLSQWMNQRPSVFDDKLLPFTQCWNTTQIPREQLNVSTLVSAAQCFKRCPNVQSMLMYSFVVTDGQDCFLNNSDRGNSTYGDHPFISSSGRDNYDYDCRSDADSNETGMIALYLGVVVSVLMLLVVVVCVIVFRIRQYRKRNHGTNTGFTEVKYSKLSALENA
jgi:hypothetical protein